MNPVIKLSAVMLCATFTICVSIGIHSAWKTMTPFWAGLATGMGVMGVLAWWFATAFILMEDWRQEK